MAKPKNAITEYRNYYLPLNFPVLLLSGDHWKISDVPSGRLHFHNCMELGICHSEGGMMEFYGQPQEFHAGDITCIPRNIPHTTYSAPGTESHWSYIFINPEDLFRNLFPTALTNYDLSLTTFSNFKYILGAEEYPKVYYLVNAVVKELEEQKPCWQISARGLLLSLFIELYRIESLQNTVVKGASDLNSPPAPEYSLVIAPVLNFIEDNYMQPFSTEFLADLCHWSPTHFRRVFHEIMGISPLEYVNNTRIMKACNMLRSTEDSILTISENVGFHSISSFNRYFIKVMQQSPRDYRRKMLQADKRSENQTILEFAGWMYPER